MALAPINPTQLTPPRVAFIDERSGAISREWYRFFLSLLTATQTNQDEMNLAPDTASLLATYDAMLAELAQATEVQPDGASASDVAVVQNQVQDLNAALPPDLQTYLQPVWSSLQDLSLAPSAGTGTVTSVAFSGGTIGLTVTGSPITTNGTITLAGTLAVANGGTGVTSSTGTGNVVLSTSPTLVTPILGTPTSGTVTNLTGTASININGTVGATTPDAGSFTTLGWTGVKYSAAGSAQGPAITDYFTSTISLDASSTYDIDCIAYFLKSTAGTATWTWTFSSAPDAISSFYTETPPSGFTTTVITGTAFIGGSAAIQTSTTLAHAASSSMSTAVYHMFRFKVLVNTNAATTIQLRSTQSAGTLTPQAGSYMRATKVL
jgi:hypothetical protein